MSKPAALLIAPQWMGDAVMTHSLIRLLDDQYHVDVLCVSWLVPVYQRMRQVRKVIPLSLQHGKLQLSLYWKTAQKLKGQYQRAFVIPRKLKSALIPWLAGIPQRTGYLGESRYGLINDRIKNDPTLGLWLQKVVALFDSQSAQQKNYPFPDLTVNSENAQKWQQKLAMDKPLIAFMPGASYGPSKQWPIGNFAELAALLAKDRNVVILGGKNEQQLGEQIKHGLDETVTNLCGVTALQESIDILSICDQAVTNDSGLMHVAASVGCHVHALYGSSSPDYTPPLTRSCSIYSDSLECKPCFERKCPFGHYDCWKKITPIQILEGIYEVSR